jgi:competence protein ComFC
VADCISATRPTAQLKAVTDPSKRQELVNGLYAVAREQVVGKNVLLFDDLFRSGTTMNAITDVLLQNGGANSVRALTITKTRRNQ